MLIKNLNYLYFANLFHKYSIVLLPILIYLLSSSWHNDNLKRFTWDDAYILMSSAKTLNIHNKLSVSVFHESLFGITSPLYVVVLYLIYEPNIEIYENIIRMMNTCFGMGRVVLLFFVLLKFHENQLYKYISAIGGSILFSFHGQSSFLTSTGMETNLYVFIFLLTIMLYVYKYKIIYLPFFSIVLLFIRPDTLLILPIYSALFFVFQKYPQRELKIYYLIIILGIFVYALLFFKFTGHLIPNTGRAKYNYFLYSCMSLLERSQIFFEGYFHYIKTMRGLFFLSIIGLKMNKHNREVLFIFSLFIILHSISSLLLMPDGSTAYQGRYFILVFIGLVFFASSGLINICIILSNLKFKNSLIIGSLVIIILFVMYNMINEKKRLKNVHREASLHHERLYKQALYIKSITDENDIISSTDLGIITYASERKIIDLVGLGNPEVGNLYIDESGKCIPNEKRDLTNIFQRFGLQYLLVAQPWDKSFMGNYIEKLNGKIKLIDSSGYDLYKVE